MVKLDFCTDFTRFLEEKNKINHTVKVVTKSEVIECSGAVLCQHSDILLQLVAKDNELFLDNYSHVQDCLLVLHGAEVALNMDNILDLMKFSVQFGINEIYLQCLDWIENNFRAHNVMAIFKICNSLLKFAKLCGAVLPKDVFAHVVTYLKMVGPVAVMELYKDDDGDGSEEMRVDFLRFLTGPRSLLTTFAPLLSDVISADNVDTVISLLADNLSGITRLSEHSFKTLMNKIDSTVFEQSVATNYINLKAKLFTMFLQAEAPFIIPEFIPEGTYSLTDAIVNDKLWIRMDFSQLVKAQKLFEKPSMHFIYSEIMIAWIKLRKPSQAVVTELFQGIIPYKLGADYITMLNCKHKALGYTEPILPKLIEEWEHPTHYISDAVYYSQYGSGFVVQFKISCRNKCSKSDNFYAWFNQPANDVGKQELPWGWYNYTPPSSVTNDILRCPDSPVGETSDGKKLIQFFGTTRNNVHLQFHTDWSDTLEEWRAGGYVMNIGCVQFNSDQ